MIASKCCPGCGGDIPPGAPIGLCATCLLQTGLDSAAEATPAGEMDLTPILDRTASALGVKYHCFGDYDLLEEIARGGMGVVFKARQISLHRIVAVKVIRTGRLASPDAVRRFHLEAKAAASLDHPNIVPIYEVGEQQGHHYFSMKLVEGGSLAAKCELERETDELAGRPALRNSALLLAKVAHAVHCAHQHGIIHRDLKPGNILLDRRDEPQVTDFGLAKLLEHDHSLTLVGDIMGTPGYMSPEQAAGAAAQLTTASDIWSLGVILYELLAGRPPFRGATAIETLRHVTEQEPASLRTINRAVDRDLETICLCCLEKDAARRYPSADALAKDLEHWLHDEPIDARPVRLVERVGKWARRQPMLAAAVVLLNLVLALGIGGVLWQWRRANDHASKQQQQRLRTEEALERMQVQRAEDLFARGNGVEALTTLADVIRRNPSNRPAAERLLCALVQRSFLIPATPPLRANAAVHSAQFSSDGRRLLVAAGNSASLWDPTSGHSLSRPFKHAEPVRSARFSPDGLRIVTASDDHTARVWDARTGQPLTEPLRHADNVSVAQFSPDGRRIATVSKDATVRFWDAHSGQLLTELFQPKSQIRSAQFSFSRDFRSIVTVSGEHAARVWDADTGQPLTEPLQHDDAVLVTQFSPDGRRILTACADGTARVWDAQTGQLSFPPLQHESAVRYARFSPDGRHIATASADRTARLWDAQTGEPLSEPLRHAHEVSSVVFSPFGRRVITACDDRTARVWDAQTGAPMSEAIRHDALLRTPGFSPDGRRIFTISGDTVWLWNAQASQPLVDPFIHDAQVQSTAFSPESRRMVTASGNTARVWDLQSNLPLSGPLIHAETIRFVQFSPDGRSVVTASDDRTARVWNSASGQPITPALTHGSVVLCARFSPDGGRVVTASEDGTARLWDARTGQPLTGPLQHGDSVWSAQFSPDGRHIVTATDGRAARLWDAQTGQIVAEPLRHAGSVWSAQFSPDGRRVVTASGDRTARVWDAQSGQPLTDPLKHDALVHSARFSPDGRLIVTVSGESARLWDSQSGQPLAEPLVHDSVVRAAQFSPDGRRIVTASDDHSARVWDAQTGQPLTDPLRHPAPVGFAEFSPDGRCVGTVSGNESRIWPLPTLATPAPPWLANLAEAVGGWRLNTNRVLEPVPEDLLAEVKKQIAASPETSPTIWARWILADRDTRTISPDSPMTVPEYVRQRIAEDKLESLRKATTLDPDNALALARLARRVAEQNATTERRASEDAEWLMQRALALAPNNPEILAIREAILESRHHVAE